MLLPNWHRLIAISSVAVIGTLGFWNIYQADAQAMVNSDYVLANSNLEISAQPSTTIPIMVAVRNLTNQVWAPDKLRLGTVFSTGDTDRASNWKTETWLSATRIGPMAGSRPTYFNQIAVFSFTIKAPLYHGVYKEYFRPLIEGEQWLVGEPIVLTIRVGDGVQIQEVAPAKEVKIYRKTQQADWLENGVVVATLPISSGKSGYTTPAGEYTIINQFEEAYSAKYSLYMGNWMGIAKNGVGFRGYGMHSLAYWKIKHQPYPDGTIKNGRLYTNGRVYEDVNHLGEPMSHGCIRFGIQEAKVLYNWASVGTPVTIV